jgi:hypothetical protein
MSFLGLKTGMNPPFMMRKFLRFAVSSLSIVICCAGCGSSQHAVAPPSPEPTPVLSPEQQQAVAAAKERGRQQAAAMRTSPAR